MLAWLGELIGQTCPSPPALVGHGLGGAIMARFASEQGERIDRLVLVDAFGLGQFEPAPTFGSALNRFLAEPSEQTRDGLFQQCFVDLEGVRTQMGERWGPIAAYALDRARTPGQRTALGNLMPQVGVPAVPSADLARIAVPTTLIWGRHDLQVRLQIAEAASARYGWPLHVIEDCGDDPPIEPPAAFMRALRPALTAMAEEKAAR